jgi:hypothetical protein
VFVVSQLKSQTKKKDVHNRVAACGASLAHLDSREMLSLAAKLRFRIDKAKSEHVFAPWMAAFAELASHTCSW